MIIAPSVILVIFVLATVNVVTNAWGINFQELVGNAPISETMKAIDFDTERKYNNLNSYASDFPANSWNMLVNALQPLIDANPPAQDGLGAYMDYHNLVERAAVDGQTYLQGPFEDIYPLMLQEQYRKQITSKGKPGHDHIDQFLVECDEDRSGTLDLKEFKDCVDKGPLQFLKNEKDYPKFKNY